MEKYEEAENDYMLGMKYKDIAAKYGVTINTIKSWKQRYQWGKPVEKGVHTKTKKCAEKEKKCAHKNKKVCKEKSVQKEREGAEIKGKPTCEDEKSVHTKSMHTKRTQKCTQNKRCAEVQKEEKKEDEKDIPQEGVLSEKQRLFCLYYVKYRNQVKAYQKAYNCTYENACSHAYKVWKNVEIQKEISRILDDVRKDVKIDIMDLIQQQIDIARADITDFVDLDTGEPIAGADGSLIKECIFTPNGINVKLYDKQRAIDFLTKNLQTDGTQKEDAVNLVEILLHSRPNRNLEDFEDRKE